MIINAIGSNIVPKNRLKAKTNKMNSLPADLSSYNSQKFEKSMARDTFVSSSNAMQNNKKAKDVSFAGRYVDPKVIKEEACYVSYGSSGSGTVVGRLYQESYKPYCWESQDEIKKHLINNSDAQFRRYIGNDPKKEFSDYVCNMAYNIGPGVVQGTYHGPDFDFYTRDCALTSSFNREESLKCEIEDIKYKKSLESDIGSINYQNIKKDPYILKLIDDIKHLEQNEKSEKAMADYYNNKSDEESKKLLGLLTGKSAYYALEAKRYNGYVKEIEIEKENREHELYIAQDNAKDKIKWLQGEVDALAEARQSGSLVDISVRNIDNPDLPLEDFLKKEYKLANDETKTYNTDWVDKNLIALPNATMKVVDVLLMALGVSKASAFAMSLAEKKFMITPLIKDSGFADKVLDGMKKVL